MGEKQVFVVRHALMIVADKESFVIRALEKKLVDAGINCFFAKADVDSINAGMEKAYSVVFYNTGMESARTDVLYYLKEKLVEQDKQLFIVGDPGEIDAVKAVIDKSLIIETFSRPLDNENFVYKAISSLKSIVRGETKKSIIIVDDDAAYMGLIREWLKEKYKIYMANSGTQAIKALATTPVDLILLDYEMPIVPGPQVLEMLRSEEETKNIPVIFLTGKGDRESVMKVIAMKPEGYFLKSVTRDELLENLDKFFKDRVLQGKK